jgi:hypothetical protein
MGASFGVGAMAKNEGYRLPLPTLVDKILIETPEARRGH